MGLCNCIAGTVVPERKSSPQPSLKMESRSRASTIRTITIAAYYFKGPYTLGLCGSINLAAAGGVDECGITRDLAWDSDNDGEYDDATGQQPFLSAFTRELRPGLHPISVRASSRNNGAFCPSSVPLIHNTNVTVVGSLTPPIFSVRAVPASGNAEANIGEGYRSLPRIKLTVCLLPSPSIAVRSTWSTRQATASTARAEVKRIAVTVSLDGVEASKDLDVTVTSIAASCATSVWRRTRREECVASVAALRYWSNSVACHYPNNLQTDTKLYNAFASSASSDAQLIESVFGDRTRADALHSSSTPVDSFTVEAAATLLNAETV
eukprot:jgi/Chlat1/4561/Chrsp29S04468